HMPYKQEGGVKFTDHQIQSPLLNIENSCQVCHKWSEKDIKDRVYSMQTKHLEMMTSAEEALVALHIGIGEVAAKGASVEELAEARRLVSLSQMYWDYVSANNGMGVHAPQESARVLTKSLKLASDGLLNLASVRTKYGLAVMASPVDIATKEKAQAYIKPFVDAQAAKKAAEEKAAAEKAAQASTPGKAKPVATTPATKRTS
nr:ammonia-forming cytochrome c nitrite reductase subunit c552 [Fimbriimonadaceae bacterium]